ncbi:MAG: heme ABC exporter ATP-binding protein CcmA [Beijerinckiaceae bacterium]|jgi:heme exporter protein A|nr:heme ABC exporter ATP-binding protein CcmA [Beijerinckiaceae bacterium]
MDGISTSTLCIRADGLAMARGGIVLADNISFCLRAGEGLIVTGANGAGKSTLLRVIAGLLPAAAGRATLEGGGAEYETVAAASHYLGHQNALKPALTVAENLEFWRSFNGNGQLSVDEALAQTGLLHTRDLPYAYLSTGQKRRISIARLLLNLRPVWILDEPTAGLDAQSTTRFAAMMGEHLASGGILIAATHAPLGLDGLKTLQIGAAAAVADS